MSAQEEDDVEMKQDTAAGDTAARDTAAGDTAARDSAEGDTAAGDTAAADATAEGTEAKPRRRRRGHLPRLRQHMDWVQKLEDDDSRWNSLPWEERLKKGGATVPPEFEAEVERIANAAMEMSADELEEEMERIQPEGYVDTGDETDVRSNAFWEKLNKEYWEEASKDIDEIFEFYEDVQYEKKKLLKERQLIHDMFPGDDDWLWEVHRRRLYWKKTQQSRSYEEFDDDQVAELHKSIREAAPQSDDEDECFLDGDFPTPAPVPTRNPTPTNDEQPPAPAPSV